MRGDAFFGDAVHIFGADLDFELMSAFGDERGVQRLIEIGSRHGDEVFEAARNGTPCAVKKAESGVAILFGRCDDANSEEIEDLINGDCVLGKLLLNRVEALDASFYAGVNFCFD
jgi:hypothetical protein